MVINLGLTNFCLKTMYGILFPIKLQGVRQEASHNFHAGY